MLGSRLLLTRNCFYLDRINISVARSKGSVMALKEFGSPRCLNTSISISMFDMYLLSETTKIECSCHWFRFTDIFLSQWLRVTSLIQNLGPMSHQKIYIKHCLS